MSEKNPKMQKILTREGRLAWCIDDLIKSSDGRYRWQKDIAEAMGTTASVMSRAVNGDESILTDSFLIRFNRTFSFRYSLSWLIDGTGEPISSLNSDPDSVSPSYYKEDKEMSRTVLRDDSDVSIPVTDSVAQDPLVLHLLAELKHRDRRIATLESQLSSLVERLASTIDSMSSRLDDISARLPKARK